MKPVLNNDNYFNKENNIYYTGSSQIKEFLKCESYALAKLNGKWEDESSNALLQSSYIDEYFSGTLDSFKEKHPEMFKKDGDLKAEFKILDDIIKQAENDTMFMKYLNGEHQVIMTGEIAGVPVKIKIDSYFKDKVITDLKCVKDFNLLWNDKNKCKENFIDYYDYLLQAALYQEIVFQQTGKKLPFIIAAMTKEKISERALLNIPQEDMDAKLAEIKEYLPRLQALKKGELEPVSCGCCEYCKSKTKVTKIYNYKDYFDKRGGI